MPFIVLMTHGEAISPTEGLTLAGLMTTIRKANAVLACLPEGQRVPRPKIICGPDSDCLQTADIFSAQYVSGFKIEPALGEEPEDGELEDLARTFARSAENIVGISHAKTANRLLRFLAAAKGEGFPAPLSELKMDEVVAVNINGGSLVTSLQIIKAPKFETIA
jgi:hypothetical protein